MQDKVGNVKTQMQKNLDSAMQRGENLGDMEERAGLKEKSIIIHSKTPLISLVGNLANTAGMFQKSAMRVRRKERCTNIKVRVAMQD